MPITTLSKVLRLNTKKPNVGSNLPIMAHWCLIIRVFGYTKMPYSDLIAVWVIFCTLYVVEIIASIYTFDSTIPSTAFEFWDHICQDNMWSIGCRPGWWFSQYCTYKICWALGHSTKILQAFGRASNRIIWPTRYFSYKVAAGLGRLMLIEVHGSSCAPKFLVQTYEWRICTE